MSMVKFYSSSMGDAPVLSGVAGALASLLEAVLVTGFHLKSVDSINVISGIATVSISTGHQMVADSVALIAGSSVPALNGDKRIISVTGNTFTFDATGVADQTVTGAINCRISPAGWEKPFSATNQLALRSGDPLSTGHYFFVDDTGAKTARVVGHESMESILVGVRPFPTPAQLSGGAWFNKSSVASSVPRNWFVVADAKTLYLWVCGAQPTVWVQGLCFAFGDFESLRPSDPFGSFIMCGASDQSTQSALIGENLAYSPSGTSLYPAYCPRSFSGLGVSIPLYKRAEAYFSTTAAGSGNVSAAAGGFSTPNLADGSLLLTRHALVETRGPSLRGFLRGVRLIAHQLDASNTPTGTIVDLAGSMFGKKGVFLVGDTFNSSTQSTHSVIVDVTGPWD